MEFKPILAKLLSPKGQKRKMQSSWIALFLGLLLLFSAVLIWINFQHIMDGKSQQDSMSAYLIIGKTITDENSGINLNQNLFSESEIEAIKMQRNVTAVGKLTANQFPVSANIGGKLGFHTALFLESANNVFLDKLPKDWQWQPGQNTLPILLSNDFLNLYNYGFALSQGFPQLSQKSIQSLPFQITIAGGSEKYNAEIVGFTDRISSILVPQNFMEQMNAKYSQIPDKNPARLIVKVKDPSDQSFIKMLQEQNYNVNADQLKWNRIRTAVQAIISAVGIVAILIVGMSILSFILFLEITIYRAQKNIQLLKQMGYAPLQLRKFLIRFFFPWISSAAIAAALSTFVLDLILVIWLKNSNLQLSIFDAWVLPFLCLLFVLVLYLLLKKKTKLILDRV